MNLTKAVSLKILSTLLFALMGAQARYLGPTRSASLTETVANWRTHAERGLFALVHPSPRNVGWLKHYPWFETEVVPELRGRVKAALAERA